MIFSIIGAIVIIVCVGHEVYNRLYFDFHVPDHPIDWQKMNEDAAQYGHSNAQSNFRHGKY